MHSMEELKMEVIDFLSGNTEEPGFDTPLQEYEAMSTQQKLEALASAEDRLSFSINDLK